MTPRLVIAAAAAFVLGMASFLATGAAQQGQPQREQPSGNQPQGSEPQGSNGQAAGAASDKPYQVVNGKVDQHVYNGWRRYTESCLRCHGPDGSGSSYAPALTDSLKQMTKEQFDEVVVNGRVNVSSSQSNVMPAFGEVEDVVLYLDDMYAYLKARSDGAVGRGRPERVNE